jgi:2-phosphoglycerate kinase
MFALSLSLMTMSTTNQSHKPINPWVLMFITVSLVSKVDAFSGIKSRSFTYSPKVDDKPKLILIGGPPGTGKSTFGMSVALDQGILKCISTDTIRAVMRSFVAEEISPALHRSSYAPSGHKGDDPVRSWRETCKVLEHSIEGLCDDALARGVSLVVEGVHVVPSRELIDRWEACGGVAIGCLLTVTDEEAHKTLLRRRGFITGNFEAEDKKIKSLERVRLIQDEMIRLGKECDWLQIEQKLEPDPLEVVATKLWNIATGREPTRDHDEQLFHTDKECVVPPVNEKEISHVNEASEVEL